MSFWDKPSNDGFAAAAKQARTSKYVSTNYGSASTNQETTNTLDKDSAAATAFCGITCSGIKDALSSCWSKFTTCCCFRSCNQTNEQSSLIEEHKNSSVAETNPNSNVVKTTIKMPNLNKEALFEYQDKEEFKKNFVQIRTDYIITLSTRIKQWIDSAQHNKQRMENSCSRLIMAYNNVFKAYYTNDGSIKSPNKNSISKKSVVIINEYFEKLDFSMTKLLELHNTTRDILWKLNNNHQDVDNYIRFSTVQFDAVNISITSEDNS